MEEKEIIYVCNNDEFKNNSKKLIESKNKKITVFKTKDGEIFALDYYCYHMGKNILIKKYPKRWSFIRGKNRRY
jgi:nitrite reductase/ring-hydroxylating ferredoxin subunit